MKEGKNVKVCSIIKRNVWTYNDISWFTENLGLSTDDIELTSE